MYSKIQYISSGTTEEEQLSRIVGVLQKGIKWVQLRFKTEDTSSILRLAQDVKRLQSTYDFIFIINDHVDLVNKVNADGLHLGLKDERIATARLKIGPNKIIGGTANTINDVQQRIDEGCDYIGLGPLRFTKSKKKLSPILGFEGYKAICEQLKDRQSPPIYAIGGVTFDDIAVLTATGLYGVAMSSCLERENVNDIALSYEL